MSIFDRKLVAEIIIMLSVVVGAWFMFAEPRLRELSELESQKARVSATPAFDRVEDIGALSKGLDGVRTGVRAINRRSRYGVDPSDLYGLVMALGQEYEVEVQRILPSPKPKSVGEEPKPVSTISAEIAVRGGFSNLMAFLEALAASEPYTRPVSATLLPYGNVDAPELDCRLAIEMLHFEPDPTLVKLLERGNP